MITRRTLLQQRVGWVEVEAGACRSPENVYLVFGDGAAYTPASACHSGRDRRNRRKRWLVRRTGGGRCCVESVAKSDSNLQGDRRGRLGGSGLGWVIKVGRTAGWSIGRSVSRCWCLIGDFGEKEKATFQSAGTKGGLRKQKKGPSV